MKNKIEIRVGDFTFFRVNSDLYRVLRKGQEVPIYNENGFVYLLPILEEHNGVDLLNEIDFPSELIIETALKSNSEYWINEAIKHIKKSQYTVYLTNIYKDSKYSQKLRHSIKKLLSPPNA